MKDIYFFNFVLFLTKYSFKVVTSLDITAIMNEF
jgi:hypothetical protein